MNNFSLGYLHLALCKFILNGVGIKYFYSFLCW